MFNSIADKIRDTILGRADVREIVKEAEAQEQRDMLEERKAWAADLAVYEATDLAEAHRVEQERAPLLRAMDDANAALQSAKEALGHFNGEAFRAQSERERAMTWLRTQLFRSASPRIEAFVATLSALIPVTYEARRFYYQRTVRSDRPLLVWTNSDEIEPRVAAIRAAVQACGPLQYEALTEAELTDQLQRIRASIPDLPEEPAHLATMPSSNAPIFA